MERPAATQEQLTDTAIRPVQTTLTKCLSKTQINRVEAIPYLITLSMFALIDMNRFLFS